MNILTFILLHDWGSFALLSVKALDKPARKGWVKEKNLQHIQTFFLGNSIAVVMLKLLRLSQSPAENFNHWPLCVKKWRLMLHMWLDLDGENYKHLSVCQQTLPSTSLWINREAPERAERENVCFELNNLYEGKGRWCGSWGLLFK